MNARSEQRPEQSDQFGIHFIAAEKTTLLLKLHYKKYYKSYQPVCQYPLPATGFRTSIYPSG